MLDVMESVRNTLKMESEAIAEVLGSFDIAQVQAVCNAILECKNNKHKVVTAGCGTSAAAARKIAHTLSCVEIPAVFLEPSDAVHGGLGMVQEGDVVVLLSKGGKTEEITMLVEPCKTKGAMVVAVTEAPKSVLATGCDLLLKVAVSKEPDPFNMLATSSIIAVIAMFDAISIVLMQLSGFSRDKFAVIHPHGAVGERLLSGEK